jgi:PAS domain S-box-containing protein
LVELPSLVELVGGEMSGKETAFRAQLRAIAERVDDIAIRANQEGVVEAISLNGCQRLRVEREQIVGRSMGELLHPDDRQRVLSELWRSAEQMEAGRARARLQRGDGTWLPAEITGIAHVDLDGTKSILIVGRDLSERERKEERLPEREAQFRLLADTVPAMLWMSSADGSVTTINRAGLDFLGNPAETNTEVLREGFVHPEDQETMRQVFERAVVRREPFSIEIRVRDGSGAYRWVLMRAAPRFGAEGEFDGLVGVTFDVTESKLSKASLDRSERLATIGTLATGIAREINSPLDTIRSAAESALTTLGRAPSFRCMDQSLKRILTQVERASKITHDLVQFARSEPGTPEPRDLNGLVLELVDQLRGNIRAAQATVECQLDPNLPHIPLAWTDMVYTITNLLQNAVQSSERPVHVSVRTETRERKVLLIVSDDGDGIPEEMLTRIFDPFFTTRRHFGGTGLGLSMVQRIVRDHGGTIEVQSTLDRGTSFIVSLPIDAA